ncbi:MAG: ATP phosphoribosyltransferase regulatory subunit [Oceanococcus sp.]
MQWLLPEGVDEILPPGGWVLEDIRRQVLDEFRQRDYQLILPPLVEHADALLSGVGSDLDLLTFRLTDQLSGRQLAVRADITPQAARIDARHLAKNGIARICYLGTVMRTRPDVPGGARCYRQLGAELFGDDSVDADAEILELMVASLRACGLRDLHLDLGHVGIFRALSADLKLNDGDEQQLFDLLQIKASEDVRLWSAAQGLTAETADDFATLCTLHGGVEVLETARQRFSQRTPVLVAIEELSALYQAWQSRDSAMPLHVDLAELRGYRYQTGVVFAAFSPGEGRELARGGRYNGVGADFGVDRPATGFSADLNRLVSLGHALKEL